MEKKKYSKPQLEDILKARGWDDGDGADDSCRTGNGASDDCLWGGQVSAVDCGEGGGAALCDTGIGGPEIDLEQ